MTLATGMLATAGSWIIETLIRFHRRLPRRLDLWLAARAGFVFGRISPHMRRPLVSNLRDMLGLDAKNAERTADAVFRNFALTLHDFFIPDGVEIDAPNRRAIEEARAMGRGVLALTFHLGNWELGARAMQTWGWPVTAVYQPYRNQRFRRLIESNRARGVNFVPVGGVAARGVRDALRRGDVVAMLGDHPFGETGGPVELFGRRVMWPRGPLVLAVREGCPIVVATVIRLAGQSYRAIIEEPIVPRTRTLAEVERLAQEVADKFGSVVRLYPTQWYRFRGFEAAPTASRQPVAR